MSTTEKFTPGQRAIVLLIAAVQFTNILDFVMVMPLGPYFATVGVKQSSMGLIGAAYTAAACVSGLVGASFLDRFDRRKALAVAMMGLVVGTAAGGFAQGMGTLMLARSLAGIFGGPATSLSFSIISDVIPVNLRGRAIGMVMGAFAGATVLGVPTGLLIAQQLGWRATFFVVAGVGLLIVIGAILLLPPINKHLEAFRVEAHHVTTLELLSRPLVRVSFVMTAVVMMAGFVMVPNISNFLHLNFGVEMGQLKYLYLIGGIGSLIASQSAGRAVDKWGAFAVGSFGTALVAAVVWFAFAQSNAVGMPIPLLFVWFMMAMAFRNVPYNTLTTRVPGPTERARFQSIQSAVQHGASALAASLGPLVLTLVPREPLPSDEPGEVPLRLVGMERIAWISLALSFCIPLLLRWVEQRVPEKKLAT